MEFAGVLAADWLVGELMREPVNDDQDACHQSVALAAAAGWLNRYALDELVERSRLAVVPSDGGDAA